MFLLQIRCCSHKISHTLNLFTYQIFIPLHSQYIHTWRQAFCCWLVHPTTQTLGEMLGAPSQRVLCCRRNTQICLSLSVLIDFHPLIHSSALHFQNTFINMIVNHAVRLIFGDNTKPEKIVFQKVLGRTEHMV